MSTFLLMILLSVQPVKTDSSFNNIGTWSNVVVSKSEDPHASGYVLQLWRHDGEIVGFLSNYVGPVADPPFGKLENIVFDDSTGEISFTVKMSIGMIHSRSEDKWVPSKDLFRFNGKLKNHQIVGNLEHRMVNIEKHRPVTEEIILTGEKEPDPFWKDKSYAEWEKFYEPILKYRGPKW